MLEIEGRRFAAGLVWLERAGPLQVTRMARRYRQSRYLHWRAQTGYADAPADDGPLAAAPAPALAAALLHRIEDDFWMALLVADDGRGILIKAREGAVLADGDQIFPTVEAARHAFNEASALGWSLHAMADLVPEAAVIEVDDLATTAEMELRPVPFARMTARHAAAATLALAILTAAGAGWIHRRALEALLFGPPPAPVAVADAVIATVIDGAALVRACGAALAARPPHLLAWRLERIECPPRLADPALLAGRPELAGQAVAVIRWRLENGRPAALHRRLAERQLAGYHLAQVSGREAWALQPLGPVQRQHQAAETPPLVFRRAVDRTFGPRGAEIVHGASARVSRVTAADTLADLAGLVAGLGPVEALSLARAAGGPWVVDLRPPRPALVSRATGSPTEAPR